MKKIVALLIACVLVVVCVTGFICCGKDGKNGLNGTDGKSAYEIWLDNGHSGTETDFLNWLKGEKGDQGQQGTNGKDGTNGQDGQNGENGKSAYQIWIDNGHSGTEQDFLNWLKGEKGNQGQQGTNGKDGVGIADIKIEDGRLYVKYTNSDEYVDLGQVKGADGQNGQDGQDGTTPTIEISADGYWVIGGIKTEAKAIGSDGKDGTNGQDGANGKSAYEIWLACGNTGSELDFLNWLKGAAGEKGDKGDKGDQGKSAYEIFKDYYPNYTGSELEWITAIATGDKCALFGHSYDDGVITKQPTKDEEGEMTYTCSICKGTKIEVLPKLQLPTTYEENGKTYVKFGSYPQTHVSNETLLTELNKLSTVNSRGYYSYNGEEYAKVTATPYRTGNDYLYSDGTAVTNDITEWFKVEPIKWRVLVEADGTAKVVSTLILDTSCFYVNTKNRTIDGETIYPNNYKYSTLREFLNNSFYKTAFTLIQQCAILTTEVDNSASTTVDSSNSYVCENTMDKVYALSCSEILNTTYFTSDIERLLEVTDFAKAKGVYWNTRENAGDCGYWWLRSPDSFNVDCVRTILDDIGLNHVDYSYYGVVPAMQISIA